MSDKERIEAARKTLTLLLFADTPSHFRKQLKRVQGILNDVSEESCGCSQQESFIEAVIDRAPNFSTLEILLQQATNEVAEAALQAEETLQENRSLLETLKQVVQQACHENQQGKDRLSSGGISAYAEALCLLEELGRVRILEDSGRLIIAEWVE